MIGGLLFATFSTLLFVPLVFAGRPARSRHTDEIRAVTKKTTQTLGLTSDDGHFTCPRGKVWRAAKRRRSDLARHSGARLACALFVRRGAAEAELRDADDARASEVFVNTVNRRAHERQSALLTLPATLRGDNETSIYARVSGYVRSVPVDIGSSVTKGQVLAELDTPELDQQVAAAVAQVENAKANIVLGEVALERWKLCSRRTRSQDRISIPSRTPMTRPSPLQNAAEANLKQLQATTAFKHVARAFRRRHHPRNVDIGNLGHGRQHGFGLFTDGSSPIPCACPSTFPRPMPAASRSVTRCP